jgi:hypothetical protein
MIESGKPRSILWLPLLLAGAGLLCFAALVSGGAIERALLGKATGSLAEGPTLLRAMAAVHGLILIAAALSLRRSTTQPEVYVEPRSAGPTAWLILGLLLLIALALRLWRLESGMWIDEILMYVDYAKLPLGQTITTLPNQNQHMLYTVLANFAFDIFGESIWAFRLPAVLFGVASIWALFMLAKRLTDTRQALLACAILTVASPHIWFSQSARGYTGLLFFSTLATWLWIEALPRNKWSWWLAYAVTIALGMWTHMTNAFVVMAHGLTWLILLSGFPRGSLLQWLRPVQMASKWKPFAALLLSGTLTLQLYALSLPQFLREGLHEKSEKSEWTGFRWFFLETIKGLHVDVVHGIAMLFGAAILTIGLISILRRNWVAAAAMILPGPMLCATMLGLGHNLWPRFLFFCAGFGILILVHGIMETSQLLSRLIAKPWAESLATPAGVAGCLLVVAVAITAVRRCYDPPKQDFGGAREYVEKSLGPRDAVVSVGIAATAYKKFYAPQWPTIETQAELNQIRRTHSGTWLVYTMPIEIKAEHPDVWQAIEKDFDVIKIFPGTLGDGAVRVCRARSDERNAAMIAP